MGPRHPRRRLRRRTLWAHCNRLNRDPGRCGRSMLLCPAQSPVSRRSNPPDIGTVWRQRPHHRRRLHRKPGRRSRGAGSFAYGDAGKQPGQVEQCLAQGDARRRPPRPLEAFTPCPKRPENRTAFRVAMPTSLPISTQSGRMFLSVRTIVLFKPSTSRSVSLCSRHELSRAWRAARSRKSTCR